MGILSFPESRGESGCCYTVISTTEDFPNMFDDAMAFFFFTKNNSRLEHGGGLQLVSPQPQLQLPLQAGTTGLCFRAGEGWLCFSLMPVFPAAAKSFSRVRLCATPQTAAHQAPPSLGFSRQEHWSGLLFPPPMHESEQ